MCSVLLLNIVTIRGNISKDKTTFFLLDLRLEVVRSLQNLFYLLEYNEFKTMNRDITYILILTLKDSTRYIHETNDFLTLNKSLDL